MKFIQMRTLLAEQKPDLNEFLQGLDKGHFEKDQFDLLLRKAVQSKISHFSDFCTALVRKGANINFFDSKDNVSNLMLACEKGTLHMVESLVSYSNINLFHTDARKLHAGFYAVENKSRQDSQGILKLLLNKEPSLAIQEAGNQTLLIAAIKKGKVQLVKLLLDAGADPNWKVPDTGNTSLHDAVKQMKNKMSKMWVEIVRLLLLKGGDSCIKNKQMKTVYDYAEKVLPDYKKIQTEVKEQLALEEQKVFILEEANDEGQLRFLMQKSFALFQKYQDQSEQDEPFEHQSQINNSLTEEIINFQKQCLAEYENVMREVKPFLGRLQKIVQSDGFGVQLFGSFATGLWVRQSNIDIQLTRNDYYEHSLSNKDIIEKVYDSLKRSNGNWRNVNINNRNGRISIIRLQFGEGKPRIIHISVADRNQNGKAAVNYIRQQLSNYSELRPIFLVLKTLTCHFKLNDQKNGGIRSYTLFIMLLSCILKWNSCNLGKLLIDYLFYFGFYYDHYELRQQEDDYSLVMHIMDPLNLNNDLGKHLRTADLQKMFRSAYIALHTKVEGFGKLKMMFDTRKIDMS